MDHATWMRITLVIAGAAMASGSLVASCRAHLGTDDTGPGETGGTDTDDDTGNHCVDDTSLPDDTGKPPDDTGKPPDDTGKPPDDTADACPEGMALVAEKVCMDRWEASRPDATSSSMGTDTSAATSRYGVRAWMAADASIAAAACEAAGKRLCSTAEWIGACGGPDATAYPYGEAYEAETCNGIDAFCDCGSKAPECTCVDGHGYADCYDDCGGEFGQFPTGSFPGCTNEYGVYDLSGNLWEYTWDGAAGVLKGGAYNCGDSVTNHRCDFVPDWTPSARGFRCCADP